MTTQGKNPANRFVHWRTTRRSEIGDTLIELLIAIVVIGVGATALITAFGTVIAGSAEHRQLSTIDTILRSFAETAKSQIQLQRSPIFTVCATDYTLASLPSPVQGPLGTAVTVFGTGFTPGVTMSVQLGGTTLPPTSVISGQIVPASGNVTVSFAVPAAGFSLNTAYTVALQDGTVSGNPNWILSATPFTVTSGTASSTSVLSNYTLSISNITTWDALASPSPAFVSVPCYPSGIQEISLTAIAPTGVSDSTSFVVINPAFVVQSFTPTVSVVASPAGVSPTSTLTFTATVAGPANAAAPTGTVQWSLTGPGSPTCSNSALSPVSSNSSTTTCTVTNAEASPPSYQAVANYKGDSLYVAASGSATLTVVGFGSSVAVVSSPGNPTLGSTITFTATVTGPVGAPAPTGNLVWNLSGPGSPSCANSTLSPASPNSSTASCAVPNVLGGTYTVAPAYGGDSYYASASGTGNATVGAATPAIGVASTPANPVLGATVTFTVTVTGQAAGPAPTRTITWTLTGPTSPTCPNSALSSVGPNSSVAQCTVTNASGGTYIATATYAGDANYSSATGSGSSTVGKSASTINVNSAPSSPWPGSSVTFTATVAGPVGDPAPTGSVTWSLTGPGGPSCPNSALTPFNANSSTTTCVITGVSVGTYSANPNYGGDSNYLTSSGSGSVVVANPPMIVNSLSSADHGGTPGLLQVGDTFSITFDNAVLPSTINQTAGATTLTLCGGTNGKGACAPSGSTNVVISGLSVPAGFTVPTVYEKAKTTSTAAGTLSLSNGNKTVTYRVTAITSGPSNISTGSSTSFSFFPNSSITDTNGTAASGSYSSPAILLF